MAIPLQGYEQSNPSLRQVKRILGVASGKGGVGKSLVTVNLAAAFAQQGLSVGILDADIYGPSIPTMLVAHEAPYKRPDNAIVPAVAHGIKLMSMDYFIQTGQAAALRAPIVTGLIRQFLTEVDWGELDVLLVDFPPGTGDIQLTLAQECPMTAAVITTTPQEIALIDARKAVSLFAQVGVPVAGIVENMSIFVAPDTGTRYVIFPGDGGARMAAQFHLPLLGEIPIDPALTTASDSGDPLASSQPESPTVTAFAELAKRTLDEVEFIQSWSQDALMSFTLQWKA